MKKIILIPLLLIFISSCGEDKVEEAKSVESPIVEIPYNGDSIVAIEEIKANTPAMQKIEEDVTGTSATLPVEEIKDDTQGVVKIEEKVEEKPSVFESIKDKILKRNKAKTETGEKAAEIPKDVQVKIPLEEANEAIKTEEVIIEDTKDPVVEKAPEVEVLPVVEKSPEVIKKEETAKKKIVFPKLEANIKKLKETDISSEEVEQINQAVESAVVKAISETATTTDNIEVCNALDEIFVEGCKREVILENTQSDTECEQLSNSGSIDSCKDTFNETQALEESNVALCDRLLNPAGIIACKNRVFLNIAKVSLDITICEQLSEAFEKQECKRQIETEIQLKKEHDEEIQQLKDNFQNQDDSQ